MEHLTSSLPLRSPNYFGVGSVEVTSPGSTLEGSATRRLAITSDRLVSRPHPSIRTIPDVVAYAAETYGTSHNAVGWRDIIAVHEEIRETVRKVGDEDVVHKTPWKVYELTEYKFLNFVEFQDAIRQIQRGLLRLGVGIHDVVNIYSQTSVNWQLISHACASISTAIATAYDTLGEPGLTHSLNEPECTAIFTNADLLPRLSNILLAVPELKLVLYDGTASDTDLERIRDRRGDVQLMSLNDLRNLGMSKPTEELETMIKDRQPTSDTLACIMYTSGSTGPPKGVCISHGNLVASIASVSLIFGPHVPPGDIYLAYLPLAHILEYIVELCALFVGITSGYGRPKTLTDAGVKGCRGDLLELKPHIMFGAPSVWETIRKGIVSKVNAGGVIKKAMFYSALEVKRRGIPGLTWLGENIVLSKVREATGGRLRFAMNGGAAISKETQEFLSLSVMPMMQGYGMTESCGMCALLPPELMQYGVVGLPVPSLEIKLMDVPAAGYNSTDNRGEVCLRGPSLSKGYYKRPDLNSDENIWTRDGWFKTGDVGQWNEDGTITLIDRVKNLVKMQNGEYIALEKLESIYKSCDLVSNLCVHAPSGASKPIAVIVPHELNLRHTLSSRLLSNPSTPSSLPSAKADLETICNDIAVNTLVLEECIEIGKRNGFTSPELLSGVVLTPNEWTPENGMVTAAQKVQRAVIAKTFDNEIKSCCMLVPT